MKKPNKPGSALTRRSFLQYAAALSAFTIVPRYVIGGRNFTAPSDMLQLGFIGTGKQSNGLLRSFLGTGKINFLAAADVYDAKLQDFLQRNKQYYADNGGQEKKGCTGYQDFRELLARKDIDAVVIASPDHWHAVHAVKAMAAGKDVYCEKPLALTIAEGRAMADAARKFKRVLQTGSMQRSWPEFRQTAELVRNGYLGDITEIQVSVGGPPVALDLPAQEAPSGLQWDWWLGPNTRSVPFHNDLAPALTDTFWPKWRNYKDFGGGGMTDWGAHMFDIVQWALDMDESGPVAITPPDGKDFKALTFEYKNGIPVRHENFGITNAIKFTGTKGTIVVQRKKIETTPATLATQVIGPQEKQVYRSENHYEDWITAIANRSQPVCNAETGHRTATMCTLGNIAYELGRPLRWNPKKEKFVKDDDANRMLGREMRPEWSLG